MRGLSLHSLCAGPRTGGFFVAPLLAMKAETASIIVARLSSKPMVAGPARAAELKEATVRGVCTGRTKALPERTERRTTNMRILGVSGSIAGYDCDEPDAGGNEVGNPASLQPPRASREVPWTTLMSALVHPRA